MARSSTTFRPKWKAGDTTVIRVPKPLVGQVLEYARTLDEKVAPQVLDTTIPRYRTSEDFSSLRPVNVASVPQRSPFRYPGGKTWLVPHIRSWLINIRPKLLIEPFAGGGIVGLTAAFEQLAERVILVERDTLVASVWHTILEGQAEWLARRILEFDLTIDAVRKVLDSHPTTQRELAFSVILRNRVQRGGIMAPGAGLIKTGENGRGLSSRWYPETLARRIREIEQVRDRITLIEGDGFEVLRRYADEENAAFFIDPPYLVAARRLYTHWQVDHDELLCLASTVRGDVLLTYDKAPEIESMAARFRLKTRAIAMKNTHHSEMSELLIGRSLSWLCPRQGVLEFDSQSAPVT